MRRALFGSLALVALLWVAPSAVQAVTMTFDTLSQDLVSGLSTYTEDSLTLAAVNDPPEDPPDHFHPDFNLDIGTTGFGTIGAVLFSSDGTPQRLTFQGGALFALLSVEVFDIDAASGPIVFSASSGATQSVDAPGLITFGPGFRQVTFMQIDVPVDAQDPSADRFIGLDTIQAQAVPEPTSLALVGLGLCGLLGYRWRQRQQAS